MGNKLRNHSVWRIILSAVRIVILAGMAAASFYSLYRYAEYGMSTSDHPGRKEDETESSRQTETDASVPDTETECPELLTKTDTDQRIRVRILGNNYQDQVHQSITVTSGNGMVICRGDEKSEIPAGNIWKISMEDTETGEIPGSIILEPEQGGTLTLPELIRSQKEPSYSGKLIIYPQDDGLALINEVDLEEYLYSVVSSEMPSDYPREALCAQAVCARTYALKKSIADLDDSVSFQVYNNYGKNDASVAAVDQTRGVILNCDEVLYYSTSCLTGHRTDLDTEQAFRQFLKEEPEEDAEYGSPWLRWTVSLSDQEILENLQEAYKCGWDQLEEIHIPGRSGDGQAQQAVFSCGTEEITADGEYTIRKLLSSEEEPVLLRNGESAEGLRLLPSAYIYIEKNKNGGWDIFGGGYGHGQGMSQYGAAAMASAGADYREILEYYYGS